MNSRYELPPLNEGVEGETSLFSWVVTINFLDPTGGEVEKRNASGKLSADYRESVLNLTHESIHFIHALSTSYLYRSACLFWDGIRKVIYQIQQLPSDTPIMLPLQVKSSIGALHQRMRTKAGNLSTPDISGISALDIIEGSATYITHRMHSPNLNGGQYLHFLETQYRRGNLHAYSDAYRLAEWYLGDDVFDLFSVICFLALCTEDPGSAFCKYVRELGRSGILRKNKRLSVQEVVDLGVIVGVTELRTAPQEIDVSGQHPILFAYIQDLIKKFPEGFLFGPVSLAEFAARPYEYKDNEIFRYLRPPLTRYRGGDAFTPPTPLNFLAEVPSLSFEPSPKDNVDLLVSLTAI